MPGPITTRIAVVLVAAFAAAACTQRLYEGPDLPAQDIAVVHVGDTSVLNVDDRFNFALPPGMKRLELAPGPHRIVLGFQRPATTIGMRDVPAQHGVGTCTLDFVAAAGGNYWLGSRPVGTDWTMRRWDGAWEGWVRDPSIGAEDDIVARCKSGDADAVPAFVPAAAPVPPTPAAAVVVAPAPRQAAVPAPAVSRPAVAAPPVAAPPVAAPVPPAPPAPARVEQVHDQWLRLGTWNLRGLGTDGDRDYASIAAAIDANFDILTLTELADVEGSHPGYDRLRSALGDTWAALLSDASGQGTASDRAEHYAIVYRRARLRPCPGWQRLRYTTDPDGGAREAGGFQREPAFACFEAGEPAGRFMLGAYRATSAENGDDIAAEVALLDAVFAAMSRARPDVRDLIIAGQFHLEAAEIESVTAALVRTRGGGAALNLLGEPTQGLRDHVVVRDADTTTETNGDSSVLDVRGGAASPRDFRRSVSDHLPVMLRLRVSPSEVD